MKAQQFISEIEFEEKKKKLLRERVGRKAEKELIEKIAWGVWRE